jgi:2-hydroxycyclohexanecarboxyl-CoA dehydrogenase
MGKLDDKIAIVTGAGQGIGQAIAGKLATEGATVVVSDLDQATAQATADAWPGSVAIRADVTDRHAVQVLADQVAEQFGRIDVLVNKRRLGQGQPVRRLRAGRLGPRDRGQPLRRAAHLQGGAAGDGRPATRSGSTASAPARPTPLFASFAGPKLREALTRAIPFRRLGQPEDAANVVAFLASDEAAFVTGQTISVSGGLTMS